MASELLPCPFCSKTMMLRSALWPSEGDADAIIHADPTDCPMLGFSDGSADGSIIEKWNCSLSNEDDFPSDGSCVRCGSVPRNANGLCNTCLDEDAERIENTRPTLVAPVSPDATGKCGELVTVGNISEECLSELKQMLCGEIHPCNDIGDVTDADIELVARSQAEELLAAERARYVEANQRATNEESLKDTMHRGLLRWKERAEKAEADNAALRARVKELEADRDHQSKLSNKLNRSHAILEAKLTAAEKALEPFVSFFNEAMKGFTEGYAERTPSDKPVLGWNNAYLLMQHFIEARATLGGKPS